MPAGNRSFLGPLLPQLYSDAASSQTTYNATPLQLRIELNAAYTSVHTRLLRMYDRRN